jgi:hypothetical protein
MVPGRYWVDAWGTAVKRAALLQIARAKGSFQGCFSKSLFLVEDRSLPLFRPFYALPIDGE